MDMRDLFRNAGDSQAFKAGETVFAEGTPGEVMFVIMEGEIELRVDDQVIVVLGPGELLGEMALIDSKARSGSAIAKTDARLVAVDQKRFLFLIQQTPFFAIQVMRVLTERLRMMNERSH
jgi:CRP/FNR family transcriptional regulator, cyclic AMP receptor protein